MRSPCTGATRGARSLNSPKTCGFALAHPARTPPPARKTNSILRERTETPHGAVETITMVKALPSASILLAGIAASMTPAALAAQATPASPIPLPTVATSIAARTAGFDRRDGFLPIYLDPRASPILLELPRDSTRALLMITQATGLGSNPIGIDRGSSGETQVARFDRDGDRVHPRPENGPD